MNSTTEKFLDRMMEKIQADIQAEMKTQVEMKALSNLETLIREGIITQDEANEFRTKNGMKPKHTKPHVKRNESCLSDQSCGGGSLRDGRC